MICNQTMCERPAAFRFTWPGRDEAGICEVHGPNMKDIAEAMGMHVRLIPLSSAAAMRSPQPDAAPPRDEVGLTKEQSRAFDHCGWGECLADETCECDCSRCACARYDEKKEGD